ncbi:4-diphosphocytidyl-2C-methyl-D-erythritol kinase [Roseobacter denitrificans]|uniref:4-diphosphocytidyl-2-C-methyl-D-erythritol kinase n=1 Tax=Roseobacter denitrificans (strain ATCC 33942 / OCh 114) TaxID=375451 RepID=ISPE_ROSDO|nr:4-(cytidine 5'-diphospho)-2-C-methyl-D-erythritol kinase [Roseobacter denitrificans]Q163E9.1 RecName: Full=4-diphosphocytidyl-2-C-methyl-D-erythritol kinase; Short=CMK; AltName: Full=4-(cytidine-5'-diphospho)-2-C-methyl-D-erythritol kinase [Roseobacter denitrificans OCh 114]ABG32894.1 4-diphosphocytidyl-2C-methyl-D-erythritol kinase, putative [Roseobacter denitrificans OCh 114]AVL52287.1 4-diphosphocytidyl-2C-methyl-D-erythritol kinase [Roseobacter denitrificans]SFG45490.1 4-diphosphocytidyl
MSMPVPQVVEVFAPAKINLTLHVTGQRPDGYHLLDSLVAFADVGDVLRLEPADVWQMKTVGPEAEAVPDGAENLVLKAAALLDGAPKAAFTLTKNLPVASGIGGGSADAAAAFRGLCAATPHHDPNNIDTQRRLLSLGADIPMCLHCVTARITGIGEEITPVAQFPALHAVLINPRVAVSTPAVFKAMKQRNNPPMPDIPPESCDVKDLVEWLRAQRNDMQEAATTLEPAIATVQAALEGHRACQLARMSGSGATCFGLFHTAQAAQQAARDLSRDYPQWWIRPTQLGSQAERAVPRLS